MGISKQMQLEEMDRNSKTKERLSESVAREDDVGFKDVVDDNLGKKINKEDK